MTDASAPRHASYSFGDAAKPGVLLGFPLRQVLPVGVGVLVATFGLMTGFVPFVVAGPVVGLVFAFVRWRNAPLYEFLLPGLRLAARKGTSTWTPASLLAAGPGFEEELPKQLVGIELLSTSWPWTPGPVAVVRDHPCRSVSATVTAAADGFPMRSLLEQDAMLAQWGACLAPLARPQCPASRITWQEWSYPRGVATHRARVAAAMVRRNGPYPHPAAVADYELLLDQQGPVTVAHEVTLTLSVELRRVRRRRRVSQLDAAIMALGDELELLMQRLASAGIETSAPLSPLELACLIRKRSDPSEGRPRRLEGLRQTLAAATGRAAMEWGPMAVEESWSSCRVDGSWHRTYRMASMPMLPVPANWLDSVLTDTVTTRTVTLVYEPIPLNKAAAAANREATSLEASSEERQRRGFRVTARERRRLADVEARETELACGHPEFRHAGLITVSADSADGLDEAAAQMENAAGKSLLELRPLVARQASGWVASLPLGRSFRPGRR